MSDRALDLAGLWKIRPDPLSQGLADHWFRKPQADGWCDIRVPSAWQSVLGANAHGLAWYRRVLPNESVEWVKAGDHVRLRFDSVATECRVWIGETEIGRHLGDWMPFEFDLTDALKNCGGLPELFIRVDQYHAPRPAKGVVVENGHIAKGFHDVLSIQHAGIWGGVQLRRTGPVTIAPNGVAIDADPRTRRVAIAVELSGAGPAPEITFSLKAPDGSLVSTTKKTEIGANTSSVLADLELEQPPVLWSPKSGALYSLEMRLQSGQSIEHHSQRVGFRTVATGGPNNSQILLNDQPLQIRGILHWGHEPKHIAPAPPPAQIRAEFAQLKALGFNCVCLCMFYPPDYYYDIADETGLLIWQEHPIWKSRMTGEFMPEYQRCYEAFFRRDRRHPSVVIVSATCEHEAFDAELGKWWWNQSARMLPRTLRQLQTGFLEQTPPDQTDLYDDHVYDNAGRWVNFLEDMQSRIAELPPRPFVMGETIISNAWPDLASLREARQEKPWWLSHGLDECEAFEKSLARRFGEPMLQRFKQQAQTFAVAFRKFQAEAFRMFPRNAGFVTNSIRDVPICRIGFMDDLDRWRFRPEDTRAWLNDVVLLLRTPDHARALPGGQKIEFEIGLSNFGVDDIDSPVTLHVGDNVLPPVPLKAGLGEIRWRSFDLAPANLETALQILTLVAELGDHIRNKWQLVVLPGQTQPVPAARLGGLAFTAAELQAEFEERAYSSGWGLPCRTWQPRLPDTAALLSAARVIGSEERIDADVGVLVTHRLTPTVHDFIQRGGRCILLAHRNAGGLGSKWINLWGQLPLIIESTSPHAVIRSGESDAVLTLLPFDLTRWTTRAIPSDDLGPEFVEHIDPIVRYVWVHDSGVPKCFDAVFSARAEHGLLLVTCLDHSTPAGRWFFDRLLTHAAHTELKPAERELDLHRFVMPA